MPAQPENSIHPHTRDQWRQWLAENHTRADGVWLISYKKATGKPIIPYDDAVEEALCFGWIDSKPNKLDAERTMLWYAPRKLGSNWSKPNKERAVRMIAAGKMMPAGQAKIDAAHVDGSWTALDDVEALTVPADLVQVFGLYPEARGHWDAFPRSVRRGILEWILNAKRPETRAKRVEETARLAAENKRANQWRN